MKLARVKNIRKALRKKVAKKSTYVSEIFFTDKIKKGMKMHAVGIAISEEFIARQKGKEIDDKIKPSSIGMIKEYLKADEEIMKYFKKEGKFWIVEI